MTLKEIMPLFQYDEWATKRTIESISLLSQMPERDFKSNHGGILGTLIHIYWSDCLWLERWKGHLAPPPFNLEQISDISTLNNRWQEYRGDLYAFLATVDDRMLSAPFSYASTRGSKHGEPLYQQMQHKVNHSSYHRGQIAVMLRQFGLTAPETDLIDFYRTRAT
jgi:uncharacterized damage-inducible protein DinB